MGFLGRRRIVSNCSAFGKLADTCNQYLTKGKQVYVEVGLAAGPTRPRAGVRNRPSPVDSFPSNGYGLFDTIISIRRGDGNASPTMRILQTLSRFDGPPDKLVIDLQANGEYVALGTETKVAELQARDALWEAMPESEEHAKTRDELVEAAEVKPTVGKDVIKKWYGAGHLSKTGKGKAGSPERFWKLDVSRSEPPVVATNQHEGPAAAEQEEALKVGQSLYRDEVANNQLSKALVADPLSEERKETDDPAGVIKSRSVGTPTLISEQPTFKESPDTLEVD